MIDLNAKIGQLLSTLNIPVAQSQDREYNSIPLITYQETNNAEINPYIDEISYSVDVWHNSIMEANKLAMEVDKLMIGVGFRRSSKFPLHEDIVKRFQLRYVGQVDKNEYIGK